MVHGIEVWCGFSNRAAIQVGTAQEQAATYLITNEVQKKFHTMTSRGMSKQAGEVFGFSSGTQCAVDKRDLVFVVLRIEPVEYNIEETRVRSPLSFQG